MNSQTVKRGCGTRVEGGIYSESGTSDDGYPLEHFLYCPPIVIDPKGMGLTPRGVKLMHDKDGLYHIFDWVGSKFYPNVADFLEEVRRFGMSRRLSSSLDFSKLTKESRHVLIHTTGWINDPEEYQENRIGGKHLGKEWKHCPKGIHNAKYTGMCAGLYWEDVLEVETSEGNERIGRRKMPSFQYTAARKPLNAQTDYSVAIFASFPITRLAVVKSRDGSHTDSMDKASKAGLSVDIVEE